MVLIKCTDQFNIDFGYAFVTLMPSYSYLVINIVKWNHIGAKWGQLKSSKKKFEVSFEA